MKMTKDNLCDVQDSFNKIRKIGVSEGEERKKGAQSLFKEIIAENLPKERLEHPIS